MIKIISYIYRFGKFIRDFKIFKTLSRTDDRFLISWKDKFPCLYDNTQTTQYDPHYVYHPAWAARILEKTRPAYHIDISSSLYFCCMASVPRQVYFCDYRPPDLKLSNLSITRMDICHLPFKSGSIRSLSCMHTVEHIGLGRYGDDISPTGDLSAIDECKRVLAIGGNFLFVVPTGKEAKIQYNAHRIYTYEMVHDLFSTFTLVNFSFITDSGEFIEHATEKDTLSSNYGCGCFWFQKPGD